MRFFYTSLLFLCLPFAFLRLWLRSLKTPAYRKRWGERLGYFKLPKDNRDQECIWVHAVSLGEVIAAAPLIKTLIEHCPSKRLLITTMTITGSETVQHLFGATVFHVYLPYDLPFAVKGFLQRIKPRLAIIMETELWPNLFYYYGKIKRPLLVINARLSGNSFKNYQRLGRLFHPTIQQIHTVAAQTRLDTERFIALGLAPQKVKTLGNLKFAITLAPPLIEKAKTLRASWGSRPVWIAASTHAGEEILILKAFSDIKKVYPTLLLVLVPRHPERFEAVIRLCSREFKVLRRTEQKTCQPGIDIFVVNTIGELPLFYATADIAFVGGSFVPTGGHNVLEPASLRLPIITGPHLFNFTEISDLLIKANAAIKIEQPELLAELVLDLLNDPLRRKKMGAAGHACVRKGQGVLERYMALITSHLL